MFLVIPDAAHGLVAAPESADDLTPEITGFLTLQGFTWIDEIEAYTRPTGHSPNDVDHTADTLRGFGQYVFAAYQPLAKR